MVTAMYTSCLTGRLFYGGGVELPKSVVVSLYKNRTPKRVLNREEGDWKIPGCTIPALERMRDPVLYDIVAVTLRYMIFEGDS